MNKPYSRNTLEVATSFGLQAHVRKLRKLIIPLLHNECEVGCTTKQRPWRLQAVIGKAMRCDARTVGAILQARIAT